MEKTATLNLRVNPELKANAEMILSKSLPEPTPALVTKDVILINLLINTSCCFLTFEHAFSF